MGESGGETGVPGACIPALTKVGGGFELACLSAKTAPSFSSRLLSPLPSLIGTLFFLPSPTHPARSCCAVRHCHLFNHAHHCPPSRSPPKRQPGVSPVLSSTPKECTLLYAREYSSHWSGQSQLLTKGACAWKAQCHPQVDRAGGSREKDNADDLRSQLLTNSPPIDVGHQLTPEGYHNCIPPKHAFVARAHISSSFLLFYSCCARACLFQFPYRYLVAVQSLISVLFAESYSLLWTRLVAALGVSPRIVLDSYLLVPYLPLTPPSRPLEHIAEPSTPALTDPQPRPGLT